MTNFWILMLVAITISTASQFYIKKKFGIDKSGWRYKHVSNTHKWTEIILLIVFVFSLSFFPVEYMLLLFFIVIDLLRIFMEWNYRPEDKQYMYHMIEVSLMSALLIYICLL
ncbi:DUF4181 domain-containing protein [Bacillus spizizenii ATCC 6633 = JCM 2499]|uniref:DUF4181 domain-containing protein n=2 Tax=Bacillus spizizenii TaxID=96241 RepID=A0A9Q4H822_BACSC|nr:DUF4181 domain-containing protein [Bacillus spizizenii]KFI02716.1 hypothetical protein JN25_14445 [Bacillus sp. BSC154]MDU7577468.1 DUF4181 domain-containing protein [Bacillus subtilis]ADM39580.1 conserved hypothetical protein [Bacillus spizizenii str. W23]AJW85052.1 hypothetical protein BIS30_07700 [Bacillus spizizenii]EFG92224.1 hypothetical protein BSU6633_09021 [Bacillus spizizenii ATCC 6633 = JCM 2499]